jgi:hypothetical protein
MKEIEGARATPAIATSIQLLYMLLLSRAPGPRPLLTFSFFVPLLSLSLSLSLALSRSLFFFSTSALSFAPPSLPSRPSRDRIIYAAIFMRA